MDVVIAKDAQKQYRRLPKIEQMKIKKKFAVLSKDPYAGKKLEGELKGRRVIRVWPYRIIYFFNKDESRVEVSDILHRQGSYK